VGALPRIIFSAFSVAMGIGSSWALAGIPTPE
jgi:hypothetical protein